MFHNPKPLFSWLTAAGGTIATVIVTHVQTTVAVIIGILTAIALAPRALGSARLFWRMVRRRRRVLIIDDDAAMCHALRAVAMRHRFRLLIAHTVDDGLRESLRDPDLVLLDLNLAGESGLEVLHALPPSMPVCILTGYLTPETQGEINDIRPVLCLRKPQDCTAERIVSLLRTYGIINGTAGPRPPPREEEPDTPL